MSDTMKELVLAALELAKEAEYPVNVLRIKGLCRDVERLAGEVLEHERYAGPSEPGAGGGD